MGKKKSAIPGKAAAKASKKAKAEQKQDKRQKKKVLTKSGSGTGKGKSGKPASAIESDDSDDDLEGILEKMRREWEEAHSVTEELVEGPPSRRANATLTPCPVGNHLWCIGGEFFSPDGRAHFYNDVFRYTPEKDEWRKFISKTCPGPRSAHAVVATPAGGGKLFLFGGEFSSLHQNTFHHYGDFWCFDISTHSWDRIETQAKIRPSARSGHRMAVWKHYIVLFGGFYDPGVTTRYLNDLWIFDMQEYKWAQVEMKVNEQRPSARSGFSFLSTPDGILLHGGYCKEYAKGKRPVGVMLEDTWFLNMTISTPDPTPGTPAPSSKKSSSSSILDSLTLKWERRKRSSKQYAPSLRSGCTMTAWAAKNMGILFGGVTDEDKDEETLESVFHNDLNGYQLDKGRWVSMTLKQPKKKTGGRRKAGAGGKGAKKGDDDDDDDWGKQAPATPAPDPEPPTQIDPEALDADDPILTTPIPRYNAMLAVNRNTLYIYGGIYESGSHEYTLDDFYYVHLDKLDRYVCLKRCDVVIKEDEESSEDDDDDDDDEDEDEDDEDDEDEDGVEGEEGGAIVADIEAEEDVKQMETVEEAEPTSVSEADKSVTQERNDDIRAQATQFMGVSKSTTRSPEDVVSTPLPGETLAMFYARSREHWALKARDTSESRGKQLRKDGFMLANKRYREYKPILEEVEKILREAGLDEEEMKRGAAAGAKGGQAVPQSRNRR